MIDSKLLRGSLDTIILKLLDEHDEMYGYEITQKVKDLTAGEMKLTEGALYPALHRLEGKGILTTEVRSIGNRMRKYYRLTESGKTEVNTRLAAMQDFITSINLILKPKLA
jgi:DNA-binding PadR family transcriptional regulator